LLGYDAISNLALSISLVRGFRQGDYDDDFNQMQFWEHSLSTAVIVRKLAEKHLPGHGGELFTIAILHDIGKLIIHEYIHDEYVKICQLQEDEPHSSTEVETIVLGTDHSEIGEWLCKSWNFPDEIRETIRYHHQPEDSEMYQSHALLMNFADCLADRQGFKFPENNTNKRVNDELMVEQLRLKCNIVDDERLLDWDYYDSLAKEEIANAEEFISLFNQ